MKKQKQGISLISLIITIIVIIILAAIVIFSGMGTPEKAQLSDVIDGRTSQLTDGIQSSMTVTNVKITTDVAGTVDAGTNVTDGTTLYISFDASENGTPVTVTPSLPYAITTNGDYEFTLTNASGKTKTHKVSVTNYKVPTIADKVKVGDYVEYIPDTAEYTTDTNNTGRTSTQTLNTETKDWRVLYVNSETGEVLLTTNGIVNNGTYLQGKKGYFRGPTELNNICKALYSNSSLGITARSMTIEDLNKAYNYTPSEPTRYAYYPKETTFAEGDTTIEYNGKTYTKTSHGDSTAKFYTSDGGGIEKTDGDGFTYREPEAGNPVYVTQTYYGYYNPSLSNSTVGSILGNSWGWLASPCVGIDSSYAIFGVRRADGGGVNVDFLYYSIGFTNSYSNGVRPLVSLGSMLQIDTSDTARDGSMSAKAWKIIKK